MNVYTYVIVTCTSILEYWLMTMHKSMSAMEQCTLCCFRRSTIIPILRIEIMCCSDNITYCSANCDHAIVLVAAQRVQQPKFLSYYKASVIVTITSKNSTHNTFRLFFLAFCMFGWPISPTSASHSLTSWIATALIAVPFGWKLHLLVPCYASGKLSFIFHVSSCYHTQDWKPLLGLLTPLVIDNVGALSKFAK